MERNIESGIYCPWPSYIFYCRLRLFTLRLNWLYVFGQPYAYPEWIACLCYWQWYVALFVPFPSIFSYIDALRHSSLNDPFTHKPICHSRFSVPLCTQYISLTLSTLNICKVYSTKFSVFSIELLCARHCLGLILYHVVLYTKVIFTFTPIVCTHFRCLSHSILFPFHSHFRCYFFGETEFDIHCHVFVVYGWMVYGVPFNNVSSLGMNAFLDQCLIYLTQMDGI